MLFTSLDFLVLFLPATLAGALLICAAVATQFVRLAPPPADAPAG